MSSPTMLLIKPMIRMLMTQTVMKLILPRLLSWRICLIMDPIILLRKFLWNLNLKLKSLTIQINQENKNVNEILTAELERYKDQVRILKEQNNVDKASESCAQSLEIDNLKHTLSEHLKENESLEQKTVHMLTKPQFFYDHSTRQALGFQNPCYLKKAQQSELKLYDGSVIQKIDAIVICDSEETLMLEDESRKAVVNEAVPLHPSDPELLKIDAAPLAPKLQNNMTAHNDYLKHTQEETDTLREIVKNERLLNLLNTFLDYAYGNPACVNIKQAHGRSILTDLQVTPTKPG
nr:hypothetical protein [Tanacetum cinerariifolium]